MGDEEVVPAEETAAEETAKPERDPGDETIFDFLREFVGSKTWTTLTMTATFYALFQADVCQMYFSKRVDEPIAWITLFWFFIFMFDMSLNFILKIDYGAIPGPAKFFNFYLLLDVVGTVSLIPDFLVIFGAEVAAPGNATLARAARTARIGARLTRLMKLFRSSGGNSAYATMMNGDQMSDMSDSAASTFGEAVSDGISKKVIALVLVLLITVPLFEVDIPQTKQQIIQLMEDMHKKDLVQTFSRRTGPLTYFQNFEEAQLCELQLQDASNTRDFTSTTGTERADAAWPGDANLAITGSYKKGCANYRAKFSSGVTAGFSTWTNAGAAGTARGNPVEKPDVAETIAKNGPDLTNFRSCATDKDEQGTPATWICIQACGTIGEKILPDGRIDAPKIVDWKRLDDMRLTELSYWPNAEYQGVTGTEGADAIAAGATIKATFYLRNLKNYEAMMTIYYMLFNMLVFGAATGVFLNEVFELIVNPMERICMAVESMAHTMKALQGNHEEDAEGDEFTQLSSSIVKMTDLLKTSLGAAGANIIKNNLDADSHEIDPMIPGVRIMGYYGFCDIRGFANAMSTLEEDIMVYTNIVSDHVHKNVATHLGAPNKNIGDSWLCVWSGKEEMVYASSAGADSMKFADHALMSAVECLEAVSEDAELKEFESRTGEPISMGFGFHYGWAVEGAVGSDKKVDATYLSPHVNMSARMEAATKQFDCNILVSEDFFGRMSSAFQRNMRKVDRVLVVGSTWPMILYAYDEGPDEGNSSLTKKNRFTEEYDKAVDFYIAGEWADAKKLLYSCLGARPNDGASTGMLDFMAQYGNGDTAPSDWQGYRQLDGK